MGELKEIIGKYADNVFALRRFGAVPGVDATNALSSALDAAKETGSGGGTIVFPAGETIIEEGGIIKDYAGYEGRISLIGSGGNSVIKIQDPSTDKITIGNSPGVSVRDLAIVGAQWNIGLTDAQNRQFDKTLFRFNSVERVDFQRVDFGGLRLGDGDALESGLIYANQCNLSLDLCNFGGCAASTKGLITCANWHSVSVKNSQFADYIVIHDQHYDVVDQSLAWIYLLNPMPNNNSRSPRRLAAENCVFDEGAFSAVVVKGHSSEAYKTAFVDIKGCTCNVSSSGHGYDFAKVERIKMTQCFFRTLYEAGEKAALYAEDVELIELDSLDLTGIALNAEDEPFANVKFIGLVGATQKAAIRNSKLNGGTYPTGVYNPAGATVVIVDDSQAKALASPTRPKVVSAAATVSPTAAQSGTEFRLTNASPNVALPPSAGCTVDKTHFFLHGVGGMWGIAADGTDEIECLVLDSGAVTGNSGTAANNIAQYGYAEIRYVANGRWVLLGVFIGL